MRRGVSEMRVRRATGRGGQSQVQPGVRSGQQPSGGGRAQPNVLHDQMQPNTFRAPQGRSSTQPAWAGTTPAPAARARRTVMSGLLLWLIVFFLAVVVLLLSAVK